MSLAKRFFLFLKPFLFGLIFLISCQLMAQTKDELEAQREDLQREIRQINDLLIKTKTNEKSALSQIADLDKQISVRTKLINTYDKELNLLSNDLAQNQRKFNSLLKSLEVLKADYAKMILKAYKNKTAENRMLFLLSAKDFTQAYNRLKYMQQYTDYRKHQGLEIVKQSIILKQFNDTLKVKKGEKKVLLTEAQKEQDRIKNEREDRKVLANKIKKQGRKYLADIRKKQKEENALNLKIENLIKEAISKTNVKGDKGSKLAEFRLTPEAKALAAEFVSNQGKLPWPIEKGLIVLGYGTQPHPVVKSATIQSNGIRIATEKGSKARAVFNGVVLAVQVIPGGQKAVLIQHGNYISVYKNLDQVLVEKGEKVTTKQAIGVIHTDNLSGQTILAFVLFKEVKTIDPELWIKK
ncbi:MAG: peptidase M23 [Flavobacteriales bacterium CG03_land_8_20_14_0_80_35_15]|nr:MAG: peptidase M23 [Flavobacteriales bacterium CG03_land_8_20_14_0_80_35_15]